MKKVLFLVVLFIFVVGCSSVPKLSESDIATICNVDVSSIKNPAASYGV